MDIKQLRYFISVIDCKSFTKAADKLRIAQPALGLQIRKLEEELEVQLLVRHSRGVEPTEAGFLLLERAKEILQKVQDAKQELTDFSGPPRGTIVLGITPSLSLVIAADLIHRCAQEIPLVKLSLVEELSSILFEWVRDDRLDMTLAFNVDESPGLKSDPLMRENLFFVQHPKTVTSNSSNTVSFKEVLATPLMLPSAPHALRKLLDKHAAAEGIELQVEMEMQSAFLINELIAQGISSSVLPYGVIERQVAEGRVVARRIVNPDLTRVVSIVYSDRRPMSKGEKILLEIIRSLIVSKAKDLYGSWLPIER